MAIQSGTASARNSDLEIKAKMRAIMVDSQAARLETCPPNMRGRAKLNTNEAAVGYVPKSLTSALEFDRIFAHFKSVEIDLGCGDGTFLTAMAMDNQSHNFR